MFISITFMIFPITVIMERLFLSAAKRKPSEIDGNFWNETFLFISTKHQ